MDTLFEYATADVVAGSRRFPERPIGHPLHAGVVEPVGLDSLRRASSSDGFADHAWDESGHL